MNKWSLLLWWMLAPAALLAQPLQQVCLDETLRICAWEANRGAASSVVLVHGLNGSAVKDWKSQIELLAQSYHVLAIELPGFKQKDGEAEDYSMGHFSEIVRLLTRRYISGSYDLVGHSMGGVIALRHALHYPDEVRRLILADAAGVLHRVSYSREMVGNWVRGGAGEHSGLAGFLEKMTLKFTGLAERLPGSNESVNELMLQQATDPQALASMQLVRQDFSGQLKGMWVPTLILWGEDDHIAPLRTGYTLNARLPNARMKIIPGAKHIPMREQPEAFNRAMLAFLQAERVLPGDDQHHRIPGGENHSERVALCEDRSGRIYEGDYKRIELRGCERVVIRNARVGFLKAHNSRLSVLNSAIGRGESKPALEAVGADIKITASQLQGETIMRLSGSRMDLAGSTLIGGKRTITSTSGSELVFSLTELQQGGFSHYLHGFYQLSDSRLVPGHH